MTFWPRSLRTLRSIRSRLTGRTDAHGSIVSDRAAAFAPTRARSAFCASGPAQYSSRSDAVGSRTTIRSGRRDRLAALVPGATSAGVLAAISVSHLLNDTIQSLIPSIYPILKSSFAADLLADRAHHAHAAADRLAAAAGWSGCTPIAGRMPYSLVGGMAFSLVGLLLLSVAGTLGTILLAAGPDRASGRPCFIPSRPASRAWRRADGTGSRSRSSRSAATWGRRSARCSPRSSSCRTGSRAWPGAR